MKLGIIAPGYKREDLELVKGIGLQSVEFCVNCNEDDFHTDFCEKALDTANLCKELGITVGSVGRWGGEKITADGTPNPVEVLADTALIHAAQTFDSPVYVTGCNYVESLTLFENYAAAIKYFENLITIGKQCGVKIATYNCRWNNFVHSDPAWSVVHGQLPDLYIKFDPSHCIYDKGNYLQEMKKWGHRFAHVHIKGSLIIDGERFDDPPAGLDMTNWGAFMGVLYTVGYDGMLSIEPHSATWHGELGVRGVGQTISTISKLIV